MIFNYLTRTILPYRPIAFSELAV